MSNLLQHIDSVRDLEDTTIPASEALGMASDEIERLQRELDETEALRAEAAAKNARLTLELASEKESIEDLRAEVERHSNAAAAARLAVSEAMNLICQYRDDMRHPPAPDSRERRVEAIEAMLAKGGRS